MKYATSSTNRQRERKRGGGGGELEELGEGRDDTTRLGRA